MIIKALKTFSDGVIAMHEGEIANVPDAKAQLFIAEGYVVEYSEPVNKKELDEFQLKNLGYITPQMYGAKADGVADDTEAIQQAMINGDYVYFPKGVYLCSKQMVLRENQKVVGAGKDIVKIIFTSNGLSDGQTYTRGRVVTGISDYRYRPTKVANIYLEGITIDSNYIVHDPTHPVDTGIPETAIIDTSGKTLLLLTNCENVTIKDVDVIVSQLHDEASAFKVLENGHNITFDGCRFSQLQENTVGSNEIRDTPYSTGYDGVSNVIFKNCDFYRKGGIDEIIGIYGSYSTTLEVQSHVDGVLFDNCNFKSDTHTTEDGKDQQYLISVAYGSTKNIKFKDCRVEDNNSKTAIFKRHSANLQENIDELLLDNCTIINNSSGVALLVENNPTEKPLIIFDKGKIEILSGKVCGNKSAKVRNAIIINNSDTSLTNSGAFDGCMINTNNADTLSTGSMAEFVNCVITSNQGNRLLVQARKLVGCIFKGERRLAFQFVDSNEDCEVQDNIFEYNATIGDNTTSSGKKIAIINNVFKRDMTLTALNDNSLVSYTLASNIVLGTPTNLASAQITKTFNNSFDSVEYVTMAEVQEYIASRSNS